MTDQDSVQQISVHYVGPALGDGRVDLFTLSDGLRGLARLTNRVSRVMFGSSYDHELQLEAAFGSGSVVVPLHIAAHGLKAAEDALATKGAQALSSLMSILGWGAVPTALSLYKLFKRKQGRLITDEDDLSDLLTHLDSIERLLAIRVYNDLEVQAALRTALRPLRGSGIEEFQTRRNDVIIDSVRSSDLKAADIAETDLIVEHEEKTLDIEKAALVPHLAWHFSDEGKPFDAKVHDPKLWARISKGERFGLGDRMRVVLTTTFSRDLTGRLNLERSVLEVLEIEHATRSQLHLWEDDPEV